MSAVIRTVSAGVKRRTLKVPTIPDKPEGILVEFVRAPGPTVLCDARLSVIPAIGTSIVFNDSETSWRVVNVVYFVSTIPNAEHCVTVIVE